MNERINELHEQAHSYACEYARRPDYNPHNPYNEGMYKERYVSKFAELIVKETLEVARAGIEFGDGMEDAVYKYFGVEE